MERMDLRKTKKFHSQLFPLTMGKATNPIIVLVVWKHQEMDFIFKYEWIWAQSGTEICNSHGDHSLIGGSWMARSPCLWHEGCFKKLLIFQDSVAYLWVHVLLCSLTFILCSSHFCYLVFFPKYKFGLV